MLAYVFWHWKQTDIVAAEYEERQRHFHKALATDCSPGFIRSFSTEISRAPWVAAGNDAYEDWYLVQDFAALGILNQAAVSASRTAPHDAAAKFAAGGTAGLYGLRGGVALDQPKYSYWFGKPPGTSYGDFFGQIAPIVEQVQGALWMRQMVLGPAREFCLHATAPVSHLALFEPLVIPMRSIF